VIDSADGELVSAYRWRANVGGYAITTMHRRNLTMHRMLLGLTTAEAPHIDHIDGDGLNNRRSNLRAADAQKNAWNRRLSVRNKSSQFKAVSFRNTGLWNVRVRSGEKCWCGSFQTEELAARAYDVVASQWFGEFARLNFPGELAESQQMVAACFQRRRVRTSRLDDSIVRHVADEVTA
jgi:hypothetical protein